MNPKARNLKSRKAKALYKPLPLNFLLGCSENSLANLELARLDEWHRCERNSSSFWTDCSIRCHKPPSPVTVRWGGFYYVLMSLVARP